MLNNKIKSLKNKNILQNKRNYIINKKYVSIIRYFTKKFYLLAGKKNTNLLIKEDYFNSSANSPFLFINAFFSILDKAKKKGIIHQNTVNRKKSKISLFFNKSKNIIYHE